MRVKIFTSHNEEGLENSINHFIDELEELTDGDEYVADMKFSVSQSTDNEGDIATMLAATLIIEDI